MQITPPRNFPNKTITINQSTTTQYVIYMKYTCVYVWLCARQAVLRNIEPVPWVHYRLFVCFCCLTIACRYTCRYIVRYLCKYAGARLVRNLCINMNHTYHPIPRFPIRRPLTTIEQSGYRVIEPISIVQSKGFQSKGFRMFDFEQGPKRAHSGVGPYDKGCDMCLRNIYCNISS